MRSDLFHVVFFRTKRILYFQNWDMIKNELNKRVQNKEHNLVNLVNEDILIRLNSFLSIRLILPLIDRSLSSINYIIFLFY